MVRLIFLLNIMEYAEGFLRRGLLYHHFLEAAFKSAVLLYVFPVLVKGRCAYALDFTSRKCRFQHICGIHRASAVACSYNSVELVDEQNHILIFG